MEIMNQSIEQSRLYSLNIDLLRNIYEYDNTPEQKHKEYFSKNIRIDIWRTSWNIWRSKQDLYVGTIMDYVMTNWGVYGDCDFSEYYICKIFPEKIRIVSGIDYSGKYNYTVYNDYTEIFSGYVLNDEQEQSEVWGDGNWTEIDKMHVHTDYENKLYVYQCY